MPKFSVPLEVIEMIYVLCDARDRRSIRCTCRRVSSYIDRHVHPLPHDTIEKLKRRLIPWELYPIDHASYSVMKDDYVITKSLINGSVDMVIVESRDHIYRSERYERKGGYVKIECKRAFCDICGTNESKFANALDRLASIVVGAWCFAIDLIHLFVWT